MCVCIQLLSCVLLFATPWTVAARRLCPWDFPGKILERVAIPLPGDLPDPGLEPASPVPQVILLPAWVFRETPLSCTLLFKHLKVERLTVRSRSPPYLPVSLFFLSALSSSEILSGVKGSDQDEQYPESSRARNGEQTHDLVLPCFTWMLTSWPSCLMVGRLVYMRTTTGSSLFCSCLSPYVHFIITLYEVPDLEQ